MLLAVRGDKGIHFNSGPPGYTENGGFLPDTAKNCKSMAFSGDGQLFAWCNGEALLLAKVDPTGKWNLLWKAQEAKRTNFITFSPKSTFVATWEVYAARNGEAASPNLRIWNVSNGTIVKDFVQRKADGWAPQWSKSEQLCCVRGANNEAFFYSDNDFSNPTSRLSLPKMLSFSMSPTGVSAENIYHVVAFLPGQKGGPAFAKLFAHPKFHPDTDVIASKSFFNADKLETEWSPDGKSVLLLCHAEVDKTGASYYGKTQLHYMDTKGETSMVQLPKEGPVYNIVWSPTVSEFCVVYGYMPAKATLFNKKCEPVFDFGTGPRNMAAFNPQGTILMLAGFGNLRGNVEMWDCKTHKEISKFEAPDSTDVKWAPNGQLLLTSTCAPRLRMGNGFKIWHYTSTLMYENFCAEKEELWEVKWQSSPEGQYPPFPIETKPIPGGVKPSQPIASKQAYRPPGARGIVSNFKLHDDDEVPQSKKSADPLSKSAQKNKKRREAAKVLRKDNEAGNGTSGPAQTSSKTADAQQNPDVIKKIRKLHDKLLQISKLKEQQKEGKQLELNQLEKIKKESELLQELQALQIN